MAKAKRSFYHPHGRVLYTGELVDPYTGEVTTPPSMTKQSFAAECDINNIIKSFSITGMVNHINQNASKGAYVDLPDPIDFQEAIHTVEGANQAFMSLPSKIRDRFNSDPVKFLEFLSNPENANEARSLGILNPLPPPPPIGGETGGTPPPSGAS